MYISVIDMLTIAWSTVLYTPLDIKIMFLFQKLTWRKNALKAKRSYDEAKKKKVQEALIIDLMSSEEENDSDDDSFIIK